MGALAGWLTYEYFFFHTVYVYVLYVLTFNIYFIIFLVGVMCQSLL